MLPAGSPIPGSPKAPASPAAKSATPKTPSPKLAPKLNIVMRFIKAIDSNGEGLKLKGMSSDNAIAPIKNNVFDLLRDAKSETAGEAEKLIRILIQLYKLRLKGVTKLSLMNITQSMLSTNREEIEAAKLKIESKELLNGGEKKLACELYINDDLLDVILAAVRSLLAKENNIHALTGLAPFFLPTEPVDDKRRLALLETVCKESITSISLPQIKKLFREQSSARKGDSDIAGNDVVVLVGKTGAGKSTTVHFVAGSQFAYEAYKLRVKKASAAAEHFTVGDGATSVTKRVNSVNLCDPKIVERLDHKLKAPLYVCDTPGLKDTNGGEAAIANALTIVHPLRTARSVRFQVLFSTNDFDQRGGVLRDVLGSAAQLVPNVKKYTGAFCYAFTGNCSNEFKAKVFTAIEDSLKKKAELGYSDAVEVLLQDMKAKLSKEWSYIHPLESNPKDLVKKWLALTPITNPKEAIEPFIEDTNKDALGFELKKLFDAVTNVLKEIRDNINNPEYEFGSDIDLLLEKLEQLNFVNETLGEFDNNNCYERSKEAISQLGELLIAKTREIFNTNDLTRELTEEDFEKYYSRILGLRLALYSLAVDIYDAKEDTADAKAPAPAAAGVTSLVAVPTEKFSERFAIKKFTDVIDEYKAALKGKMDAYPKIESADCERMFLDQATKFIDKLNETGESLGIPRTVRLESTDEVATQRVAKVLDHFKLDSEVKLRDKQGQTTTALVALRARYAIPGDVAAIRSVARNLYRTCESGTVDDDVIKYFARQIATLKKDFNLSLKLHDFISAASILDKLYNVCILMRTEDNAAQIKDEVDRLRTSFIEAIYGLKVAVGTTLSDNRFDETRTKQCIHLMQTLLLINQDAMVTRHIKSFQTDIKQEGEKQPVKVNLTSIYNDMVVLIRRIMLENGTQVNRILRNQTPTVQSIIDLGPWLQQLWFIMSIPCLEQRTHVEGYLELQEKVKTFITSFRVSICTVIENKDEKITHARYEKVVSYLVCVTEQEWIKPLQLRTETFDKVVQAIVARARMLLGKVAVMELTIGNHNNIPECKIIIDEIESIAKLFAPYLPKDTSEELMAKIAEFRQGIMNILASITLLCSDHEQSARLAVKGATLIVDYLNNSEKVLASETKVRRDLLQEAIKHLVRTKANKIHSHLQVLSGWQDANKEENPELGDVTALVAAVAELFVFLEQLKSALPDYYSRCDNVLEQCQALLNENLVYFTGELSTALTKQVENPDDEAVVTKLGKLIGICDQLKRLDKYLPEPKTETFEKLHKKFDDAYTKENRALYQGILVSARAGNYEETIRQADTLPPGTGLRDFLRVQISAVLSQLAKNLREKAELLRALDHPEPEGLPRLLEDQAKLIAADSLDSASLLDSEALRLRTETFAEIRASVKVWFDQCVARIHRNVAAFSISVSAESVKKVRNTLDELYIDSRPGDTDRQLADLDRAIEAKLQSIADIYKQPISTWGAEGNLSLSLIYGRLESFVVEDEESIYKTTWSEISDSVIASVGKACDELEASYVEDKVDTKSVEVIVDSLAQIAKLVANIPDSEPTHLAAAVIARSQQCLTSLVQKIRNARTLDKSLAEVCELHRKLGEKRDDLASVLVRDKVRIEDAILPVNRRANELHDIILDQLGQMKLPSVELSEFITLYVRTKDFSRVGEHYFPLCQNALRVFCGNSLQNLAANLALFQSRREFKSLEVIVSSCRHLTQIQSCTNGLAGEVEKNAFRQMLPVDIQEQTFGYAGRFFTMLEQNLQHLYTALRERDVEKLKGTLDFVVAWQPIVVQLSEYTNLANYDPLPPPLAGILTHNNEYTPAKMRQLARVQLDDMISTVVMTLAKYDSIAEKSETKRGEYFTQLDIVMDFVVRCGAQLKDHLGDDSRRDSLIESTTKYLKEIYEAALRELLATLEEKDTWESFNNYYKELSQFSQKCRSNVFLNTIEFESESRKVKAIEASTDIERRLKEKLNTEVKNHKDAIAKSVSDPRPEGEAELRSKILQFIFGLQNMINTLPSHNKYVKDLLNEFLIFIRESRGIQYLQLVATELQDPSLSVEKSGLGLNVIQQQTCFAGISIALRNTDTSRHGIAHVLSHMQKRYETGVIGPITEEEQAKLQAAHDEFMGIYTDTYKKYLRPEVSFENDPEKHLREILDEVKKFGELKVQLSGKKKIILTEELRKAIPKLAAYLFVIWTLRDAKAYFEAGSAAEKENYLKKPHAVQVAGIFCMLGLIGEPGKLPSHLSEILTGEGKSVVLAIVGSICAILGCRANIAVYSKILSARDQNDFSGFIKFIGQENFINYGTLRMLFEAILNRQGDVRALTKELILGKVTPREPIPEPDRPEVLIFDEADVVLADDFYGSLHNPLLMLCDKEIAALIGVIWFKYTQNHPLNSFEIQQTIEYQNCIRVHERVAFFEKAVDDMLTVLKEIKENGGKPKHRDYIFQNGKVKYKYMDTYTDEVSYGYETMFVYLQETRGNIGEIPEDNLGIMVNCGNYSYIDMLKTMGLFSCILGATGTLRELSKSELDVLTDELGIGEQTFTPSAYGDTKLKFPKKDFVTIVSRADHNRAIAEEISRRQVGKESRKRIRPVIEFFATKERLMDFHKSEHLANLKVKAAVMTNDSSSTPAEQDLEITRATNPGQSTAAIREKGRGTNFICTNPGIDVEGNLHGIITFFPKRYSEQRQMEGRMARQGREGSCSMVLCKEDLMEEYGFTEQEIQDMIDGDCIYDTCFAKREELFAEWHEAMVEKMDEVREKLHEPSLRYWQLLQNIKPGEDTTEGLKALGLLNGVSGTKTASRNSRTLVLIDATGSMDGTIDGVKAVITKVVRDMGAVLSANKIDISKVFMQIAVYRNYKQRPAEIFQCSDWTSNPEVLQNFINTITAHGGFGDYANEAAEVGLCHAMSQGVSQIILIGDVAPNEKHLIPYLVDHESKTIGDQHRAQFYNQFKDAYTLAQEFAQKKVPIHTFYVSGGARTAFADIARTTNGETGYLNTYSIGEATAGLHRILGKAVIVDVVGAGDKRTEELLKQYNALQHKR